MGLKSFYADENYPLELHTRYAAATDGDPACPYCHDEEGQPCGPDGYYANNLSIGSDGYIEDSDKIKYCQYCGRKLEASHE